MPTKLTSEMYWLVATAFMTALLWIPYTLRLIIEMGVVPAFWDPYHDTPIKAAWAQRAKRAHTNAVENLVVFTPLVLAVHVFSAGSALTAAACALFFFARAAHFAAYLLGVPLIRTLLFLVGVGCQFILVATLFGWIR